MGRPRLEDGRRVVVAARLSEAQAAALDKHRGHVSRSAWLAALVAAAVGESVPVVATARSRAPKGDPGRATAVQEAAVPASGPAVPEVKCTHPGSRRSRGQCRVCWEYVG